MKICVIHGSTDAEHDRHLRLRFNPLADPLRGLGHEFELRHIDSFRYGDKLAADVFIFQNCYDARSILLSEVMVARGRRVGVDLVDDLFSRDGSNAAAPYAQWAKAITPNLSFAICRSPRIVERATQRFPGLPLCLLRDTPRILSAKDASKASERLAALAQETRTLPVCWLLPNEGVASPALQDLVAFAEALASTRRLGYRVELTILTHQHPPGTAVLAALSHLGIDFSIEPWSLDRQLGLLTQSLLCFVATSIGGPEYTGAFATSVSALTSGNQLLLAGGKFDDAIESLAYRDLASLVRDLESASLKVRSETLSEVRASLGALVDSEHAADALATFLETIALREATPDAPRSFAVLHGRGSTIDVHRFTQRMRTLSVAGASATVQAHFDGYIASKPTDSVTSFAVSEATYLQMAPEMQALIWASRDGDKDIRQIKATIAAPGDIATGFLAYLFPGANIIHSGVGGLPAPATIIPISPSTAATPDTAADAPTIEPAVAEAADAPDGEPHDLAPVESGPQMHVAWLTQAASFTSASARYRAFHMAMATGPLGTEHSFHTKAKTLAANLEDVDCVVIVKRMDIDLIDFVAVAHERGKSIFLDMCDDMLAPFYHRRGTMQNRMVFAAMLPYLSGIVVPTRAMASYLRRYVRERGLPRVHIHVIADVAETPELFVTASAYARGASSDPTTPGSITQRFAAPKARPQVPSAANPMRVVWFGNFGGPHSNFGIASILPTVSALRAVNRDIPLELTVISNSKERHEALIAPLDFATRFVPWSEDTIYAELDQADLALLTNGDDDFSQTKSANRALQALAVGLPVVASGNRATEELADAIVIDDFEAGLRRYLGPGREQHVRDAIAAAQPLLRRFDLPVVGRRWQRLLASSAKRAGTGASAAAVRSALIVGEIINPAVLRRLIDDLKASGVEPMVTLTVTAAADPAIREILIDQAIIPTLIAADQELNDRRLLRGSDQLRADPDAGPVSRALHDLARQAGIAWDMLPPPPPPEPNEFGVYPENPAASGINDWLFVTPKESKGWILDAICREIGGRHPGSWEVYYSTKNLPAAKTYFFSHYWNYFDAVTRNPALFESNLFIWYTHPREVPYPEEEQLRLYKMATQVIFTCSEFRDMWIDKGLPPEKCRVVLGGADENLFRTHRRGKGVIGLSSSYYERKNPDLLFDLVHLMPHRNFHLIGRKWEEYGRFPELLACPNFAYSTLEYAE